VNFPTQVTSGFGCEWMAIVPASTEMTFGLAQESSFAMIAMTGPVLENSSPLPRLSIPQARRKLRDTQATSCTLKPASLSVPLDDGNMWPRISIVMSAGLSRISRIAGTCLGPGSQPRACSDGTVDSVRYPTLHVEVRIQRNSRCNRGTGTSLRED
jgi:hypothetical protein